MKAVRVILWKEWLELRQQRMLIGGIVLPPLLFTAIALGALSSGPVALAGQPLRTANPALAGLTVAEQHQALPATQLSLIYLFLPVILTSIIASYSIVGEKNSRTLEPILATPVRTAEFLLGKCLASFLVGVGVTWAAGAVFAYGTARLALTPRVFAAVISPGWLVVLLLWTPLLALLANAVTMGISSRVTDARAAQQVSALVVAPFLGLFFAQLAGARVLTAGFTLGVAGAMALITAIAWWLVARLFQREAILTWWK
jgi:ABC-2 type transport system permease protein